MADLPCAEVPMRLADVCVTRMNVAKDEVSKRQRLKEDDRLRKIRDECLLRASNGGTCTHFNNPYPSFYMVKQLMDIDGFTIKQCCPETSGFTVHWSDAK